MIVGRKNASNPPLVITGLVPVIHASVSTPQTSSL
jgi:hypothetical protein